jgi:hypothetical protein
MPVVQSVILHFNGFFNITQWMKFRGKNSYIAGRREKVGKQYAWGWDGYVRLERIKFPEPLRYREVLPAVKNGNEESKGEIDERPEERDPVVIKHNTGTKSGVFVVKRDK